MPDWLSVSETGLLTGTPSNDDVGSHTVTVEVVDTADAKDQATFSITVNNINDNPVFDTIPAVEADEDENFTYQLLATDVDAGDVLTFQGVDLPDWLSVSETGLLTGTPSNDDVGSHTVTVEVVDAAGAKDQATFSITVNNINDNPVLILDPDNINQGSTDFVFDEEEFFNIQLGVTDVDKDDSHVFLIFSENNISWLDFNQNSGVLSGIADDINVGVHEILFQVTDQAGATSQQETVFVTINNLNEPVHLVEGQSFTFQSENESFYQIDIIDEDLNDTHTFTIDNLPAWLELDSSTGVLYGISNDIDDGIYELNVLVTDQSGLFDETTVKVISETFQYNTLGNSSDYFIGDDTADHVETGGGDDTILSGAGDDRIIVQSGYETQTHYLNVTVEPTFDGKKYFIDGVQHPSINFVEGHTYIFDVSDPSNADHPFQLSEHSDGRHNESYYDHWYGDLGLIYKINGVPGEQGSTIEFTVPEDYTEHYSELFYSCENHPLMGAGSEVAVNDLEPSDVVVDTGTGSDHIYIENDWSGTLLLVNNESTDKLFVDQETSYSTVTEDGDWIISLTDGSEITIEGYLTFNEVSGYHEVTGPSMANTGYAPYDLGFGDMGFTSLVGSNYTNDLLYSASIGLDVIDNDTVYTLNGWDGDDVLYGGSGTQHLLGQLKVMIHSILMLFPRAL